MVFKKNNGQVGQDTNGSIAMRNSREHTELLADRFLSYGSCVSENNGFRKAKNLIEEYNVSLPSITVEYRNFEASTTALVGTGGVSTLVSVPYNLVKTYILRRAEDTHLKLLHGISGKLKPGRLTLLLGPPSCGKSTLLKALSGQMLPGIELKGDLKFNGRSRDEFVLKSTGAYVSQYDNHNPNLTVRETLEFAYICQNGYSAHSTCPFDVTSEKGAVDAEKVEFIDLIKEAWGTQVRVDLVLKMLGLNHCADTPVGDALVRGISGGERKRLTSGEFLVGPRTLLMMDEISTGLDSATLYTVVGWLAEATRALKLTTMVSLLQPPPEVFYLFDDVLFLATGCCLYHGPVSGAVTHFDTLGLTCPPRKDVPSFLLEITTSAGQRAYANESLRERCMSVLNADGTLSLNGTSIAALDAATSAIAAGAANSNGTVQVQPAAVATSGNSAALQLERRLLLDHDQLMDIFQRQNAHGRQMMEELDNQPFRPEHGHPDVLALREQLLTPREAIKAVTRRQLVLVMRDRVLLRGRMVQVIVISLLISSLFYKLGTSLVTARTFFGASFMSVLFMSFGGFPQIPVTLEAKKVFYKHRDSGFYTSTSQGVAMALSQFPLSILEAVIFSLVMYFMVGFYRDAGYFFVFVLITMATSLSLSALFRMNACIYPDMTITNAVTGLAMVVLLISSGFAIVHSAIPPWMIWAYWISPWAFALRSMVVNEMTSPKWSSLPGPEPNDIDLGWAALRSFDFYTDRAWIWLGVGYLMLTYIIFTVISILALKFINPPTPAATVPDEKATLKARLEANERREKMVARQTTQAVNDKPAKKASSGAGDGAAALQLSSEATSARDQASTASNTASPFANGSDEQAHARVNFTAGDRKNNGNGTDSGGGLAIDLNAEAHRKFSINHHMKHVPRANTGLPSAVTNFSKSAQISSSLAFQPVTLLFKNLWYTVPNPAYSRGAAKKLAAYEASQKASVTDLESQASTSGGDSSGVPLMKPEELEHLKKAAMPKLELIQDITGFSEPGVLLALMGGSGAGKTTFMDVVAGRKTIGEIKGDIKVNGHPVDQSSWSRVVGYVEQADIHTPSATVVEALKTSARLRLPPSVSNDKIHAYVDEVMEIIDLMDIMFNMVGTPGLSGLSTEQRKRLTIGVELVANPSVVFMDEPTSGLDARAAVLVMAAVRNVALNGRTVMVTIHQPSIEIFEAFDQLLLIQRGGRIAYFGNLGLNSQSLVDYLTSFPGIPAMAQGYNPATWMLEVTGGSMAITVSVSAAAVDWPDRYNQSRLSAENAAYVQALLEDLPKEHEPLSVGSRYAMPFNVQFRILLDKYAKLYWRSPAYNLSRLVITLIVSFIYGATYWQQSNLTNPATIASVQNVMGVMFSSSNFLGMTNLMSVMPVVGFERIVFYRERAASMYDPFAYGLAMAVVEIPYLLLQATIFVPIVYFMCAFESSAEKFWYYYVMFFETIAFYTIFGQFLVYLTPAMTIAQVVAATFNFLFNIFNGFIITYPDFPKGWRWMNRLAPPTWILYGLGVSQLGNRLDPLRYNGKTYTVRQFMDERFGYQYNMRFWIVLILAAYIIFFRVTSILALKYVNFLKR